jgi:hypothetical protein
MRTRRRSALSMAALICSLVTTAGHGAEAGSWTRAAVRADKQFTTYAFAHEFGSGVYDFNGRTLQVYGLPFAWTVRDAAAGPGVRLRLPVTLGFLDFRAADVISTGLPDSVDSISFVPGLELDFAVTDSLHVLPYVQAGASLASETSVETRLFGAGIRVEKTFPASAFAGLYASEAIYSRVEYRGDLPNDDFVRLRNSVEFRKSTKHSVASHPVEWGTFTVLDIYVDPPTGPTTGVDIPRLQLESGFIVGFRPSWQIWGVPLPGLGLSYRFAGDLSSVRFVIGAPF